MKKFLLCANISLVLGTLLFLVSRANAYCVPLSGWSPIPQTLQVGGYGDVRFFQFPHTDTVSVQFLGDPVWDVEADTFGRRDSDTPIREWERVNEATGLQLYSFQDTTGGTGRTVVCFVPEPSTALLGLLAMPLALRRKR